MKNVSAKLRLAIIGSLSVMSAGILAQPAGGASSADAAAAPTFAASDIAIPEMPRATQTVNDKTYSVIPGTRLAVIGQLPSAGKVPLDTTIDHMRLILKPSAQRATALNALIEQQHNPTSDRYLHWLTPEQLGEAYGLVDADIQAASAWLTSEGFVVDSVQPNKMQINFSGNVGRINSAFHVEENYYQFNDGLHIANNSDMSVPTALRDIVSGVTGLSEMRTRPMNKPVQIGQWDPSMRAFRMKPGAGKLPDAVNVSDGTRGLVPNDLTVMYGMATLRGNGVTGKGVTIALVENNDMVPADWTDFVNQFNLARFGGTFAQIHPAPASGKNNCTDPNVAHPKGSDNYDPDDGETLLDAEWSTAMAPGASIEVAACADTSTGGGVYTAAENLINASKRPDIISVSYGLSEAAYSASDITYIDNLWKQADAEGISVFVSSGDSGSNLDFNGSVIHGVGISANGLATSQHVTAVGGTDTADVLDRTTSQYFSSTANPVYGTALSYVPEIPWNESCGNGVAALSRGWSGIMALCQAQLSVHPDGSTVTSEAGSGAPSKSVAKPSWQSKITGNPPDKWRDVPDVALFADSYGQHTYVVVCTSGSPCNNFTTPTALSGGTSLAAPMFAGIQAVMDQGLAARGFPKNQGNAAPTLYAIAAQQYGTRGTQPPATLAACSSDNGTNGTSGCIFHNVTRGSISSNCEESAGETTPNCFFYGTATISGKPVKVGLTATDTSSYTVTTKAYTAGPGWSFAAGLGSVNATNLLIAWRAFAAK